MCKCYCVPVCDSNTPETPPTGGNPTQPPGINRCTRYRVNITSINVTQVDDGFLRGNLEATFTFVVNGQALNWVNNNLGTGTHNIGRTFFVDVPVETSAITLEVSGVEADDLFFDNDDPLAGFTHVWGQAQNWGAGSQSGSANDSNITYTLNYEITCAQSNTASVSRNALAAFAQAKAKKRPKASSASLTTMVAWSLDRLRRDGWELIQTMGEDYIFRGTGMLPSLVEKKFGKCIKKD